MIFALCISASVWGLTLYTLQIMYGKTQITKISAIPYTLFALAMLSTAIEAILLGDNYDAIYDHLLKANQHTNSGNQRNYFNCTA